MLKLFTFMFLFLTGCGWPCQGMAASREEYLAHKIASASVVIEVYFAGNYFPIGSGTLIHDKDLGDLVVTAEHVATAAPLSYQACSVLDTTQCVALNNFLVDWDDGIETDWALYGVTDLPHIMRPTKVSHEQLHLGQQLWQAASPEGRVAFINPATLAWIDVTAWGKMYMLSGFVRPGSSGSGVFDLSGRLIGITVATPVYRNPVTGLPEIEPSQPIVVPITNCPLL